LENGGTFRKGGQDFKGKVSNLCSSKERTGWETNLGKTEKRQRSARKRDLCFESMKESGGKRPKTISKHKKLRDGNNRRQSRFKDSKTVGEDKVRVTWSLPGGFDEEDWTREASRKKDPNSRVSL